MVVRFAPNNEKKIQDFLNQLLINFEEHGETCMSPRRVLLCRKAHCLEGAMLAALGLMRLGHRPLVVHLAAEEPDEDHVIAVFKKGKSWGAISKTNHATLRYREPVYASIRELVMSYFHEYFLQRDGRKTLRSYTRPIDLRRFRHLQWETAKEELWELSDALTDAPHIRILTPSQQRNLRPADTFERRAGGMTEYQ